jgi:hypothetical protein
MRIEGQNIYLAQGEHRQLPKLRIARLGKHGPKWGAGSPFIWARDSLEYPPGAAPDHLPSLHTTPFLFFPTCYEDTVSFE